MANNEKNSERNPEDANFEVSSLSEVRDENGNGIFHMRTKTKFILAISGLILLAAAALIYLTVEKYLSAEMWQLAVWGVCGILSLYAIFSKSLPAMFLNLVLFFGVSLIPVWQTGHETFRPVIEKFFGDSEKEIPLPAEEKVLPSEPEDKLKAEEQPAAEEKIPDEKIFDAESDGKVDEELPSDAEKSPEEMLPERDTNSPPPMLPNV